MEIRRYVLILKSRKWVVILTTLITILVVAWGSLSMTPVYSASTLVRVTTGLSGSVSYTDLNYSDRLIQTYLQLLKSRPFMEELTKRLDLQVRPETLVDAIKVEALADTELIKITVEDADASKAAAIAGTLGNLLVEQGQKLYSGQGKSAREILQEQMTVLEDQLRQDRALLASLSAATPSPDKPQGAAVQDLTTKIDAEEQTYAMLLNQYDKARVDEAMRANSISIVEPAIAPETPSKPNVKLNVLLGALVGLMAGIGLAFLLENLSPLIHSRDDLERAAGVPLLGRIPDFGIRTRSRERSILLENGDGQSPAAEAFRVLSASTMNLMSKAHLKTILFSSAGPGVGKSTVVANLAATIAETGRQVVVVDGDMRQPCLHQIFGIAMEPGLHDVLLDLGRLDLAVQPTQLKNVKAVAAGSAQSGVAEHLNVLVISKIMRQLAKDADIVLWDSPPVLAAADAALLAPLADGVVLIVDRTRTHREAVEAACQQLVDVKAKLLGIIVNRAERYSGYDSYNRRLAKDGGWSNWLRGIKNLASSYRSRGIFNGVKNSGK